MKHNEPIKPESVSTETFSVIYSLPLGFRRKLESVIRDYKLIISTLVKNEHGEQEAFLADEQMRKNLPMINERLAEFERMLEHSKQWDEGQ